MSSAVLNLWNGNIAPCEHCGSHDPQANHLISLMERNREKLCKELTASQAEILQKYIDCSEAYLLRMLELAFYEGFSLGANLIIDVSR